MSILNREPLTAHRRIAIVEAWGADDQQDQVWAALKSKGCETGADALVIVEDQSQVNPDIAKTGLPLTLQDSDGNTGTAKAQGRKKELAPEIGEAGHPGYYLDSIAIVYDNVKADRVHASH
ncbi:hypothetical protein [Candidatus Binatus sp.]|uniref:hypothetical protein n=1 Tax=Candidatus Binatus sp. TaxID=2811406 RepID=UPI003CBF0A3F